MTTSQPSSAQTTTTLAEVTATLKHLNSTANTAGGRGHTALVSPGGTEGRESHFTPHTPDEDQLPPIVERVAFRALDILDEVSVAYARAWDSCATRDWGNCQADARADLVLPDGTVLLHDVPTAFILWLEKQCTNIWHNLLDKLPTLDPRESWEWDETKQLWRSEPRQEPVQVTVPYGAVLYDATPEHPAQVAEYDRDELVGIWTHVRYSGAVPQEMLKAMLDRLEDLAIAAKLARERANATKIPVRNVSEPLLNYLLRGDLPQTSQPDTGGESQ